MVKKFAIDVNHKYTLDELTPRQYDQLKNKEDLSGKRYGRLSVVKFAYIYKHCVFWKCICDCGNTVDVRGTSLISNRTRSCGCLVKEILERQATNEREKSFKVSQEPLYRIWNDMIRRCHKPNSHIKDKKLYQDRGITVCDEWLNNFQAFYDWSIANGYVCEKLPSGINKVSIDRIDNNKGYSPDNCRWVDWQTQRQNQRRNKNG